MPDPMTRLTWDNAALMNENTAEKIGVKRDELVALEAEATPEVEFPVLFQPGMPDGVIAVALGYGRTAAGNIGNGVGQNAYLLRDSKSIERGWAGVKARPTGKTHRPGHRSGPSHYRPRGQRGRARANPRADPRGHAGRISKRPVAGPQEGRRPVDLRRAPPRRPGGRGGTQAADVPAHDFHRWGMAVDLTACTGCGACVVACQAENNIPIVGREQVLLGREMHWIRVDRYFRRTEQFLSVRAGRRPTGRQNVCPPGRSVHQPVLCMQCENAPCEEVCPFGATTHSLEGLNMMTYNRCGGTRYCSNNCPYKVRRFNFFDYNCGTLKDLYTPNLVREPISELLRMQKNPEVTVRMRGVMEKCTYCIQRIEHARIAAKRDADRPIRDGEIQTACQQTCPAGAIVFGDLNDPNSRVSKLHALARSYGLLESGIEHEAADAIFGKSAKPGAGTGGNRKSEKRRSLTQSARAKTIADRFLRTSRLCVRVQCHGKRRSSLRDRQHAGRPAAAGCADPRARRARASTK